MNCNLLLLTAAFGLLFISASAQENFDDIFGSDYKKAISFVENEKSISKRIESYGLPAKEVLAIIFPELIRYNSIQDKLETFALESLYVKYGTDYANFSVGVFQMKPSFAEQIEKDYLKNRKDLPTTFDIKIESADTLALELNRAKRVKRLKNIQNTIDYLCLFYCLIQTNYSLFQNTEEKIRFLATAYNCGYSKSKKEIDAYSKKRFFQTGILPSTKYCYADIAWYYFAKSK